MDKRLMVVIGGLILLVIVGVGGDPVWRSKLGWQEKEKTVQISNPKGVQKKLTIGGKALVAEVREDDAGRSLGLSYRTSLGEDEGMLFVFGKADYPTFWMKDMNFDLDMIWIEKNKVVEISKNVKAPTKELPKVQTVAPTVLVDSVLEVNAGWADKQGIEVGDEVTY